MKYILEHYSRRDIKTLWKKEFTTREEVLKEIDKFLKENLLFVVAKEYCDDSNWWYLNDGTELDFCICEQLISSEKSPLYFINH